MKRRIVSLLLVIVMITALIPSQAFAAQETNAETPFADVSINEWYHDAVQYVYENEIFTGTADTTFTPGGAMTRGMFVTVLGRMAGVDAAAYAGESSFADVNSSDYYAPYVAWAEKHGITGGTGDSKFSPDALINREQMATFFVRYFEAFDVDYNTGANITTIPGDIEKVSDYAKDAVLKLWKTGLLAGDGVNFNPAGKATRAQAATLCQRTDDAVKEWYKEPGVPSDRVRKDPKGEEKSDKDDTDLVFYTFKFDTNDGSTISDRSIRWGSRLNNLPTPYKENAIFIGWCYDEELTHLVSDTDTAQESAILHAKYEETAPLNEEFKTPMASAIDAGKGFTVKVSAPANMDMDAFKNAVTLQNLSSNENKDWFAITGNNGTFTISGVNYLGEKGAMQSGFVEGSAYKITLNDSSLFFEGQDESTREYVFTIGREDVVNASLNENMKQIPLADISDLIVNGASATTISIPVITVGVDGAPAENGVTVGSFSFSKGTLAVGDTIAIYEGNTPPAIDAVSSDEKTAFVEITTANGSSYTYKTAAAENVLFTPDILPVKADADTDENTENNSLTVPVSVMTYTDDRFALAGLDSRTTIDAGDFISFYTGTLQDDGTLSEGAMQGYARINSVETTGENYVIAYEPVDLSEVQASMAAYKKENVSSEELLEGVDRQALEENVELQARESGFAEEAGMYLAALALETDSFTQLSDDYKLTAVEMTMNGEPITQETLQSMGGAKAEVEVSKLQATLSTNLVHFKGIKGLRLTLDVGITVSIECNDDVTIEIEIVGSFEQEVRIDIGVDGDAVWKWWGIFPYIAEYEVTAYVELYEYTGIGIEATIATKETDEEGFGTENESIEQIGKQIKDLMDKKDKYIGDGKSTVSDSLEEKYADMLGNETDWVTLVEKSLCESEFRVLLIICINVEVKLVIQANMNISLGMDFWYENAKRYVYTIQVFSNKVKSDVIDLVEEHWEFEFYVMGTMGLRAGIKAGISIGLISTKIASVGFAAEAGAYVRVWGYFYYQLKYTASQGRSSSYSGAIYLEFGIYLNITFEAQALKGRYKYEYSLYEKEWPLLWAGDQDNVRNFAYKQADVPSINLKSYITSTQIPDSLFDMAYLDLKEGMDEDDEGNRVLFVANYDAELEKSQTGISKDKQDDEKNFSIEMTNPAFSYDPHTNTVTVTPDGKVKQDGEMIITWKSRPMEFSSVPIRRTVTLHWDNLRDGYVIVPFTNGGSYVPIIIKKYEAALSAPQNPTKAGYNFAGWYGNENLTTSYTFPKTMSNVDTNIYAAWVPATDTAYTVEHYLQKLGSSEYELADSETLKGTTDSTVTPLTKSYTGFKTPTAETLVIKADGSSVLRYYYDRQTYTVTFSPGEVGGDPVVIRLEYGSTISAPQFGAKGYLFRAWNEIVSTYMGDQDLTYTALWEKDQSTEYRVEYYVQQPDGRYLLQNVVNYAGKTGDSIEANTLRSDSMYVVEGVTSFHNVTVAGEPKDTVTITGDGKTVIKVNYKREQYSVTYKPNNGDADIVSVMYSGAEIIAPVVIRMGYTFGGWSSEVPAAVGTADLTFTAQWNAASGIAYQVRHIRQALDDTYPTGGMLVEFVGMTGTTEDDTDAKAITYEGFTAQSFDQTKIAPDGTTMVEIRYSRNSYPVNWVVDGVTDTVQVKYDAVITKPAQDPTKQGYVFDRWDGFAEQSTMGITAKTYTAIWRPATDTPYTVKHIRANPDGSYPTEGVLVVSEKRFGTTGALTAAAAKIYEGFTAKSVSQAEIKPDGSTELTIYYDRNTYTVTWVSENKTYAVSKSTYGAVISVPDGVPAKTGYSFGQWLNIPEAMPANNLSITAEFIPNTYAVSFDMNRGDGKAPASIHVTYGSAYGVLPIPTYTGYQFDRWADTNDYTVSATTIVYTPGHHTLKAIWVAKDATPYTVKHLQQNIAGDGYTQSSVETRYGQTDTNTAAKANTYEGFTAKTITQVNIDGDGSAEVVIYYDRNINTVTWNINGAAQIQSYRYGQTIAAPVATRTGYTFAGWDVTPAATMPDNELAYTAQWTATNYTVSLNGNGGENLSAVTATYDSVYPALPDSSRTGYTFSGWFTSAAGGTRVKEGDTVAITENTTLYAHWTANSYSVSFDLNSATGSTPGSINVTYDNTYNGLPEGTGTKSGYHFHGWYTAPNGGEKITAATVVKITADTTLFAQWARNTYTVKFDANGGSGTMTSQAHIYGQSLALAEGTFTKNGHTFAGWNTQADGNGTSYADKASVINLTETQGEEIILYARWSINSYTVTFSSDGTTVQAITQAYNTNIDKPTDPTKNGYSFAGWMNGETGVTFPVSLTDNLNLTAKWTAVEYAITYIGAAGIANSNPASYTIENEAITLADPGPKTGYTFAGWYTDGDLSDTGKVSGVAIASGSTGIKTFYAKWTANIYGINFDDGTESNNAGGSMTAQTFTYDAAQALSSNEFTNPGHNFIGWGIAPNSGVTYTDGQSVKNLLASGSSTLYAQWAPVTYAITYTLGSGASGANNPASYSIETSDITLNDPSGMYGGYQFLGWYSGSTKVTSIPKGSTGNVALTAKWAHGGTFTLAATGSTASGSSYNITFTVTRTLPAGTVATTDPQHVYYRTVNGTAIGGTAARIHFSHVGGEDVFLTFNQSDTIKTFVVQQEGYIGDDIVNSFAKENVSRYYDVELYKVVSTVGTCTGALGSNSSIHRTLQQGTDYILNSSFFTTEYYTATDGSDNTVKSEGFDGNASKTITIEPDQLVNMITAHRQYAKSTAKEYGLRVNMSVWEEYDGYQYMKLASNSNSSRYVQWNFEIDRGDKYSSAHALGLPITGTQGMIVLTNTPTVANVEYKSILGTNYMKTTLGETFKLQFNSSGSGKDYWHYKNITSYFRILDTAEPTVKRIAPMAYGRYKKGDIVTIAVEFNEIIGSASNVALNTFGTIPTNSWSYEGGVGTNVLVFKGALTQDFEVTPNTNMTLVGTKPTVSGTIKDLAD